MSVMGLMDWPTNIDGGKASGRTKYLTDVKARWQLWGSCFVCGRFLHGMVLVPYLVDVDLDGDSDLVSNGYGFDTQDGDAEALDFCQRAVSCSQGPHQVTDAASVAPFEFCLRNLGEGDLKM